MNLFTTLLGIDHKILDVLLDIEFGEFVLHVPDIKNYANIPITSEYLSVLKRVIEAKKMNGENYVTYASAQSRVPEKITKYMKDTRIYVALSDRAGNLNDNNLYRGGIGEGKVRCEVSKYLDHNVLLPNGDVVLCAQDYGLKHILGNLKEEPYEKIRALIYEIQKKLEKIENHDVLCKSCFLAKNTI